MKNKKEMIAWMKSNGVDFDDMPQDGELHGWCFKWGHYEPYLENLSLKGQVVIVTGKHR